MSSNLFFQGLMYLITLVYGGYLIARGQMQAADLAMYALYIGIFISPIQILVELVEMMQKGLSGFRRFLDVMETVPEIQDAPDAVDLTNVKGRVAMRMYPFIIVMMIQRFFPIYPLRSLPADLSLWWVLPAAERLQSVLCCPASTM